MTEPNKTEGVFPGPSVQEGFEGEGGVFIVPKFDPYAITNAMESQLGAMGGGEVEQSYLYWDHKSARDWLGIAQQPDYQAAVGKIPYNWIVEELVWSIEDSFGPEKKAIEIISLGPGDGSKDTVLVQALLDSNSCVQHVSVNLLDLSQPLLVKSYQTALKMFGDNPWVSIQAIQGDFFHLPQYDQILNRIKKRPCLVTMFGGTLQNLRNEPQFIQNQLGFFKKGDLLLLELGNAYASADRPDEIHRKDPRLSGKLPAGWEQAYKKFHEGPLRRHYQEHLADIELRSVLDVEGCCVPKSYAIEILATVRLTSGEKRTYHMERFVRYDKNELKRLLMKKGWEPLDSWDFGPQDCFCMYLFRKV